MLDAGKMFAMGRKKNWLESSKLRFGCCRDLIVIAFLGNEIESKGLVKDNFVLESIFFVSF